MTEPYGPKRRREPPALGSHAKPANRSSVYLCLPGHWGLFKASKLRVIVRTTKVVTG
jgi:hypothetical protein